VLDAKQLTSAMNLFWGPIFHVFDLEIKLAWFLSLFKLRLFLWW